MDGTKILSKLKHLSEIRDTKDIKQLTAALFPGSHCPLMGAMMAVGGIKDAVMLVLGTDECAYYTKKATIGGFSFKGIDNRCFTVTVDQHDVTFGCKDMLYEAFEELMQELSPNAIFLVTTCVLEVTGDDVDSMAVELQAKYKVPVLPVHTEHFKTANHIPGVRDTVTACLPLIKYMRASQNTKVNVIGQRLGNFADTQLYSVLQKNHVEIGMMLPGGTTVEDIQNAATANVNIVVNQLGLPFAEAMKEKFGTPYVMFDKYVDPDHVMEAYRQLFDYLHLEFDEELNGLYRECKKLIADARKEVAGMKYIYGNTSLACMEYNAFMVSLGMEPALIQMNEVNDQEQKYFADVLEKYDPYITKSANIAPLQYVYDVIKPNLYLGHEFGMRLRAKGIEMVHDNGLSSMLGFDVTMACVMELVRASKEAKKLQNWRKEA